MMVEDAEGETVIVRDFNPKKPKLNHTKNVAVTVH